MSGAAWERLLAKMKDSLFSDRRAMWDRLQLRASTVLRAAEPSRLIAWPDALLALSDEDVDAVIGDK